jgi:MDMPI C-terminal domain
VLFKAVADAGGTEATVATFDGPHPAWWWIRRLLHESTVHRADAVLAIGEQYELAPEMAADGIDEWLGRLALRPWPGGLPIEDGKAITLIATDVDLSWSILGRGDNLQFLRNSTDSLEGVQLTAKATDLFLALFRRREIEDAECRVEGDPNSWKTFLALTPYAAPGTE